MVHGKSPERAFEANPISAQPTGPAFIGRDDPNASYHKAVFAMAKDLFDQIGDLPPEQRWAISEALTASSEVVWGVTSLSGTNKAYMAIIKGAAVLVPRVAGQLCPISADTLGLPCVSLEEISAMRLAFGEDSNGQT